MNDIILKIPTRKSNGEIEPLNERRRLTHQEIAIMLDK